LLQPASERDLAQKCVGEECENGVVRVGAGVSTSLSVEVRVCVVCKLKR